MANNKRKFVVSLEIDSKSAEQQIKASAKNISAILENMNKSGDSMTYFKELVGYISQLDAEMNAFKKKHGVDTFNKMFGGLDTTLTNQMQNLFGATKQQLTEIEVLRARISKARDKKDLSVDEAKAVEQDVRALYAAMGKKSDMALSTAKKPQSILTHAEKALDRFVMKWESVNDRVSRGFDIGVGAPADSGLEGLSKEIQSEVDKIQSEIDKLEVIKKEHDDIISKWNTSKESKKIYDADNFTPETSVDGVQKLMNEFDALQYKIKSVDKGSVEYYDTLNKLAGVSIKLQNSRKAIWADDELKQEFQKVPSSDPNKGMHKLGELFNYSKDNDNIKKQTNTIDGLIKAKQKELEVIKEADKVQQQSKPQDMADSNKISKQGSAYDKLIQKVKEYQAILKQLKDPSIDDKTYDSLLDDVEDLEVQIADMSKLGMKAEEVSNILQKLDTGKLTEGEILSQLVDTLGIEIPAAAEKATQSQQELKSEVEQTTNAIKEQINTEQRLDNADTTTDASIEKETAAVEEQTAAYKELEAAKKISDNQKSYNAKQTSDVDFSTEVQQIDKLKEKVDEVTTAIQLKTEAFTNEGIKVNSVVEKEIGDLNRLIEKLGEVDNKIEATKQALKNIDDGVDKTSKNDNDTSSEVQELEQLKAQVNEVKAAIESKNAAFQAEKGIVSGVVDSEVSSLLQLLHALQDIIDKIENVGRAFRAVNDETIKQPEINITDNKDDSAKTISTPSDATPDKVDRGYALDTTLGNTNEILSRIASAIDGDNDMSELITSLRAAVDELKSVANGIVQRQKDQKTDYGEASDRIAKHRSELLDNTRNAIRDVDGYTDEIRVEEIKAFANGLVKVKGVVKDVESVWHGFTVAVDDANNVTREAIERQSKLAQNLNNVQNEIKEEANAHKDNAEAIKEEAKATEKATKEKNSWGKIPSTEATKNTAIGLLHSAQKYIGDDAQVYSKEVQAVVDNYTNSLRELAAAEAKIKTANSDERFQQDKAALLAAKQACNEYANELRGLMTASKRFETSSVKSRLIPKGVYDLDKIEDVKRALIDYVHAAYEGEAKIGKFDASLRQLSFTMKDAEGHTKSMTAAFDATNTAIGTAAKGAKKHTSFLGGIFQDITKESSKLLKYFTARFGIEEVFQAFRVGVQYVRDIDNALTDLKKVTNETDAGYERFLQTMSKTAGIIGSTVAELTQMSAEWARLGFSMSESADLAESTAVLMNVSEFEDPIEASQALISTIQAFGYAAEESMDVVDIMNEIGNNYAVSSDGIATALQDSASALMAGGNSMEEATAMIAAANKVVQDPSQVGSGLRTISLRLRGTEVSGELEELGEDTSGLVSSSKMREKILGLSGVDILTDTGAYKSTYQIISEIAAEWENMNDMDQAALLELMAGKNRSNIMAALLTNAKDLEGAYTDALDAEGSAYRENEAYLDSIQGRVDLFINALQTFWMNLISSDMAKNVVDFGTWLIELLDTLPGKLAAVGVAFTAFLKTRDEINSFKKLKDRIQEYISQKLDEVGAEDSNTSEAVQDMAEAAREAAEAEDAKTEAVNKSTNAEESAADIVEETTQEQIDSATESAAADEAEAMSSTVAGEADATEAVMSDAASTADSAEIITSQAAAEADAAEALTSNAASTADTIEATSSTTAAAADMAETTASSAATAADTAEAAASQAATAADMAESAASGAATAADAAEGATSGIAAASGAMTGLAAATGTAKKAGSKLVEIIKANKFIAIAAAVLAAAAAFDALTKTSQEAAEASHEKFNEISDVYGTTASNVSEIESELSTINSQISELEGRNLSFTDAQELQRLKDQRASLENNLSIQEQLLEAQEKVKNEAAVTAMKDFVKASNEGAESAAKTGKIVGAVVGGLVAVGGIAAAAFTAGTSLSATVAGLGMAEAALVGGSAVLGGTVGDYVGSKANAATVSTYEDWYKTYTDAYKEKTQAAADARKKYEKDADNMEKYDHWQKLEQEAIDVQSKMYDNLTQMQNYYSGLEYGQSDALDQELDAWNNFLDKMNIDQNGAGAKVNALDRIFGENASDEVKAFRKEIDKALEDEDNKFDIAAQIEGREDLQELENQLAEIGITTDEVSDYFRKTGEIGTEAFSDLSGEITAAKTAMTQLQTALEKNTNEGYETRNTGLEEMKSLMEKGAIGSESNLWNIAEAMGFTYDSAKSIEANADQLYKFIKVRDDWYQVDENGEWGVAGADAFAEDIENAVANSKELQDLDVKWKFDESTGTLDFDFNNMKFDEIVAALGKTKEAAGLTNEEFIDMLTHLGQFYNVQWASGNDIVSYLEYLKTTSASAKDQLTAIEEPLKQLLNQQGLNPKEIENYLTGDGSLKKLPEDLQAAVGAYRNLRKEMEKPVEDKTKTSTTKKEKTIGEKIKDFFSGDKDKKETVQKDVDVEVKADEVDTTDVDDKTEEAIKTDDTTKTPTVDKTVEVEATLEEISQSIQDIEDKEITIDVKVKGLKDVEKLNKNLDLDSKVKGNTNKLSEYAKSAKILSQLDNNISSEVEANLYGNVTDKFEFKIDNLKVFAEGAKELKDVGSFSSNVTANVFGNVTDEFEFKINNLKTFADSAKGLKDVGTIVSSVTANVEGNVLDEFEFRINNLKTFSDSAKEMDSIGENVVSKVTADVEGNVISTPEAWINNLKVFTDSAKDISSVGEDVKAKVTADVAGNVKDNFEFQIDNLKTFTDSAKDIKDVGEDTKAKITANLEGNVKDNFEFQIDNLKTFTDSAKDISTVGEDTKAKVTADVEGNVVTTFESSINNLKVFTDSAKDIGSIGEDVRAKITADIEGNVKDTFEFSIDNLKTFTDSAKDINSIGEDVKAKVTADVDGTVFTTHEAWINNLKTFVDSAKGVQDVGEDVKAKVTADVDGTVITTPEAWVNNLETFAKGAQKLQDIDSFTIKVTANVDGNVINTPEAWTNNLVTFAKGAQALEGVDSFATEVTANLYGNVDDIGESKINNLSAFANSAKKLQDTESLTREITASISGDITDAQINTLEEFSNTIVQLSPTPSVTVSVTANVAANAINNAITLLTNLSNSGVLHDYNASVTITANTTAVTTAIQNINNMTPAKEVKISETGSKTVLSALDNINSKRLNPKTVRVNYVTGTMPSIPSWPGGRDGNSESPWPLVNGTAHAKGTAWAGGTAYKGGNWGAPRTETALTGELGPEIIVRGNRWFTVGENGAEFAKIQKGDIVFNHKQSEELLKNGYVTSGGGRAKAYAQGTAWADGTAYASGNSRRRTYTFEYTSSGNSSSKNSTTKNNIKKTKSNKKKNTSDFKETFDWFEIKLEEINEQLDLMDAKLANIAQVNRGATFNKMLVASNRELTTLNKGLKLYQSYANSLLKKKNSKGNYIIPKKYWDEVKNGKIAIEEFAGKVDEKTLEAIKNYREWAQKIADVKQQLQEVKAEIRALAKEKIDNIASLWDNRKEIWDEGIQTRVQTHIDLTEESGKIASAVSYKELARQERQIQNRNKSKLAAMQAELDLQVKNNNIQRGTDEWYEAVAAIQAVQAEIDESELNLEKYQNAINQIHWDTFDEVLNRFSYAKDEVQSLIDLIDDKDAFKVPDSEGGWGAEDVTWSDEGIAKQALYLEQMEIAKKEQEEYAKELAYLEANKKNYSESEYQEKLAELTQGLYDSQDAYKAAEDGLVGLEEARIDYIKEGIEKKIEALEELTEKKKEELDAEKDLYDFQKGVLNQRKDIEDIERKLAALSGDNSAAAMAKRRQLEAELAEAQSELEDTYYDRSITNQQDLLDKNLEAFQEAKDKEIEDLEKTLEDVDKIVSDATNQVVAMGNNIATILGEIAKKNGIINTDGSAAVSDGVTTGTSTVGSSSVDDISSDVAKETTQGNQDATENKDTVIGDAEDSYETYAINKGDKVNAKGAKIYLSKSGSNYTKPATGKSYNQRSEYKNDPIFKVLDFWQGDKLKWAKVRWHKKLNGKTAPIRWFKVKDLTDINQYAKGSKGIKKDQLALVDELGPELQIVPNAQGRLDYIKKGTGIVPADLTANLMEWGKLDPTSMIDQNRPGIGVSPDVHATEINLNIQYGDMLKIENFKGDNPDEIAKIVAKQFEKHTKDLNNSLRKYVR